MSSQDLDPKGSTLIEIYVDADASPVKKEVLRVAKRYGLKVYFVANFRMRFPKEDLVEMVVVDEDLDAADNWILEHITNKDIVVTGDVPFAALCLKKDARVLDYKGRVFTEESIGEALAHRDLMTYLRDLGNSTHGPTPRGKRDNSRFLQRLDDLIQALLRGK
jgi:uncharacterized protein